MAPASGRLAIQYSEAVTLSGNSVALFASTIQRRAPFGGEMLRWRFAATRIVADPLSMTIMEH